VRKGLGGRSTSSFEVGTAAVARVTHQASHGTKVPNRTKFAAANLNLELQVQLNGSDSDSQSLTSSSRTTPVNRTQ
jgi:hypothetical protein